MLQAGRVRMSRRESTADGSSDEDEEGEGEGGVGGAGAGGSAFAPGATQTRDYHAVSGQCDTISEHGGSTEPPQGRKKTTSVSRGTVRYSIGESGPTDEDAGTRSRATSREVARSRPRGNSNQGEQAMDGAAARQLVSTSL